MAEIILTFNEDGSVTKETKGFIGKECVDKTEFLEEALGKKKGERRLKASYYEEKEQEQNQNRTKY